MENLFMESYWFENEEVRTTLDEQGEAWFASGDVLNVLGYVKGNQSRAIQTKVDEDDRSIMEMDTPSGKQNVSVINECGLYSLILSSKKPEARIFKKWVTHEVLPEIRKKGFYSRLEPEQLIPMLIEMQKDDPDYMNSFNKNSIRNEAKKQLREERTPKAEAIVEKHLADRNSSACFTELRKLWVGDNEMFNRYLDDFMKRFQKTGKKIPLAKSYDLKKILEN